MITKELVDRTFAKIKTTASFNYFFDNLSSPDWIEAILAAYPNALREPPAPEKSGDGVSYPGWSVSRYLVRMASLAPDKVLDVITKANVTENFRVHEDYVDAALNMPAQEAVQVAKLVGNWLDNTHSYFLPEKCLALSYHIAKGGFIRESLRLMTAVLKPIAVTSSSGKATAKSRFPDWRYEDIQRTKVLPIVELVGGAAVSTVKNVFIEAMNIESAGDPEAQKQYVFWRPAIENHHQNLRHDAKNSLLTLTRDAYISYLRNKPDDLLLVVKDLVGTEYVVFKRLAFYLAGHKEFGSLDVIQEILTCDLNYDDSAIWHELATLLHEWYPKINGDSRNKVEEIIKAGKWKTFSDNPESEKDRWRHRILSMIDEKDCSESVKPLKLELETRFGILNHPDFLNYITTVWSGPKSPLTTEQLEEKTASEVIKYLSTWQPSQGWDNPSVEGLALQLVEYVKKRPSDLLQDVGALEHLTPTYCRAIIDGLQNTKLEFDWTAALLFCNKLVNRLPKPDEQNAEDFDLPKSSIIRLLDKGFNDDKPIPLELRELVWGILSKLTEDSDPSLEREEQYLSKDGEYYQFAINTIRGAAIESTVQYALWIRRELKIEHTKSSHTLVPEVIKVIENHLNLKIDSQISIRAIYGRWLPWFVLIDGEWTNSMLPQIFPDAEGLSEHKNAAWSTYLVFCPLYDNVFKFLYPYYNAAVTELAKLDREYKSDGSFSAHNHLAEHIMISYMRGLTGSAELADLFFDSAPSSMKAHAIDFVGRSLDADPEDKMPPEFKERLKSLFSKRLSASNDKDELSRFGWWFNSGYFDDDWALDMITSILIKAGEIQPDYGIFQELEKYAVKYPGQVLTFLEAYASGPLKTGKNWINQDDLRNLLATLKKSIHQDHITLFKSVVNRLVALEYTEYRSLVIDLK